MEPELNQTKKNRKAVISMWLCLPLYLIAFLLSLIFAGLIYVPFDFLINCQSIYIPLIGNVIMHAIQALMVTGVTYIFLVYINRVSFDNLGLSVKGRGLDCILGFLVAAILYTIGFGSSVLLGAITITNVNFDLPMLILNLLMFFAAAWTEEVVCRGYIQGRLMTKMNKFLALGITSLIFSLLHLANPNIGLLPIINLFLAGILLGASYMYTRNLWFPIVLHLFWNWIQGPVLGYEVSGTNLSYSLLTLSLPENNILNGGAFGFEGSIICTILTVLASGLIILWGENIHNKKQSIKEDIK